LSGRARITGIFRDREAMIRSAEGARARGWAVDDVFMPYPSARVERVLFGRESPMRAFTLAGGILGFVAGLAMTIGVALRHGIATGGKPIVAVPPFLIIAFELTILFGALATMGGFIWKAGLPQKRRGRPHPRGCTSDRFAVTVVAGAGDVEEVRGWLVDAGAEEVTDEVV
jgi:molybdopterin-containing oxidoreductase family membrane subunit